MNAIADMRKSNWMLIIAGIVIGSLFSMPLMCAVLSFWIIMSPELVQSRNIRYGLYLYIALTVGLINTTKPVNESDITYYYKVFEFAGTLPFVDFFVLATKEPLYYLYTYICNYLFFGSWAVFITFTTMLMYMLVMMGYDIFFRAHRDWDIRLAIVSVVVFALFIEYFLYTAHLMRQVLAGSLAFYGIIKTLYDDKKWALFLVVGAGFIHASALIFSLFIPLYIIRNKSIFFQILLMLGIMLSFTVVLKFFGSYLDDTSTLGVAAHRGVETAYIDIKINSLALYVSLSILPFSALFLIMDRDRTYDTVFYLTSMLVPVFMLMNMDNSLFVLRFMEYCYMFIPLYAVMFLSLFRFRWVLYVCLISFMAIRFFIKLNSSDFTYVNSMDYLFWAYNLFLR